MQQSDYTRRPSAIRSQERSVNIRITSSEHDVAIWTVSSLYIRIISAPIAAGVFTVIEYADIAWRRCPSGVMATEYGRYASRQWSPNDNPKSLLRLSSGDDGQRRKTGQEEWQHTVALVTEPSNRCRFTISLGITLTDNLSVHIIIFNVIPALTRDARAWRKPGTNSRLRVVVSACSVESTRSLLILRRLIRYWLTAHIIMTTWYQNWRVTSSLRCTFNLSTDVRRRHRLQQLLCAAMLYRCPDVFAAVGGWGEVTGKRNSEVTRQTCWRWHVIAHWLT